MHDEHDGAGTSEDELDVEVPGLMDQMRIDRAISMLTGLSRSEASALLDSGAVSVDGKVVTKASVPLVAQQRLEAVLPVPPDLSVVPEPEVEVDVLFVDEDLIVVNKSFDQVVHPGAGNTTGTLISGVIARWPEVAELPGLGLGEPARPGIVHRLDKGTSGVLVIARSPQAYLALTEQMTNHTAQRRYIGFLEGHVAEDRGIVDAPIARSASTPTKMAVRPDGRPARTHYQVLERLVAPDRTVAGLELETGRTHQIRVHMSAIGHPVANDPRYGQRNVTSLDRDRLALHAGRLSFVHPATNERQSFIAPLPSDLAALGAARVAQEWLEED